MLPVFQFFSSELSGVGTPIRSLQNRRWVQACSWKVTSKGCTHHSFPCASMLLQLSLGAKPASSYGSYACLSSCIQCLLQLPCNKTNYLNRIFSPAPEEILQPLALTFNPSPAIVPALGHQEPLFYVCEFLPLWVFPTNDIFLAWFLLCCKISSRSIHVVACLNTSLGLMD